MNRLFIILFALVLSSCSSTSMLQQASQLTQNKWVLSSLGGNSNLSSLFGEKLPFLNFNSDGSVSGSDGCNNLTGNIGADVLTSGNVDFSKLASTKMACDFSGPDQFTSMLNNAKSLNLKDNVLNLLGSDGSTIAQFIQGK